MVFSTPSRSLLSGAVRSKTTPLMRSGGMSLTGTESTPTELKTLQYIGSFLTSLDPSNGDGSFLNIDFTPVPILPKFVRIVVNKILSSDPYPNLEAVDPLSSSEKDKERKKGGAGCVQEKEASRSKEDGGQHR